MRAQPMPPSRDSARVRALLPRFNARGRGLEIGPSFSPLLRKSDGYDVEILDHADAETLRRKYAGTTADVGQIEAVDYVWSGGSIADLIGRSEWYDYCIALHVIEHTVDLLSFLQDCERLLAPHGHLVLAVPDMRYGFDVLRPWSSTGNVLQAHMPGAKRHPVGKVLDEMLYNCTRDGWPSWTRDNVGPLAFVVRETTDVRALFDWHVAQPDEFLDIHAWQFTPSSLRLILRDLRMLGYIHLGEDYFAEGEGEFYLTLSKSADGCPVDRLELAKRVYTELAAVRIDLTRP